MRQHVGDPWAVITIWPPVLTRPRPDVDHPVRDPDHLAIVLDHDQGAAQVAQPDEGLDEPPAIVAWCSPIEGSSRT